MLESDIPLIGGADSTVVRARRWELPLHGVRLLKHIVGFKFSPLSNRSRIRHLPVP